MKLAEALLIGSNMQKKLAQLKCRVNANIKVQEGDTPSEDPNALMVDAPYLSQITNHKSQITIQTLSPDTDNRFQSYF